MEDAEGNPIDEEASVSSGSESSVESMESYVAPLTNSVTLSRAKRSTAGSGMQQQLAKAKADDKKKAQMGPVDEADEEFWNQEFFKDDAGDDSFDEDEDVDEEDRVDKFDSDFNDSEDEEDDAMEQDEDEEEEGSGRGRKGNVYKDPSAAGKKRKKAMKVPIIGKRKPISKAQQLAGVNRGLSLGWANTGMTTAEMLAAAEAHKTASEQQGMPTPSLSSSAARTPRAKNSAPQPLRVTTRHSAQPATRQRSPSKETSMAATSSSDQTSLPAKTKPKPKRTFTQEFLLTEAVTATEPSNVKWLHGRRRDLSAPEEAMGKTSHVTNDVAMRFNSVGKTGVGGTALWNTLTFPKVDLIPDILKARVEIGEALKSVEKNKGRTSKIGKIDLKGVIEGGTGPITEGDGASTAKYFDPLTKKGYSSAKQFNEIRRKSAKGKVPTSVEMFNNRRGPSRGVT